MTVNKTQILQNAQAYAVKGLLDKAIEEWQKLISESPNDGNIYNTIGDLHLKKNDLNQAVDAYLKAAEAFHTAGFALKTIAVYKKIIKLSPKRYDVYLKLANVNAERGLTGNAIEDYLAVAKHYSQDGRIKEALDVYRKIANLDPNNTSIRLKLAEMCLREGYEDQAVAEYLQAASVYTESGKTQEAEAIYERVLKLDPKNEVARIALGMVPSPDDSVKQKDLLTKAEAAEEEGTYELAEQLLRQLITANPANPIYHEKLGYLFLKKNQQFMAFTELKSAAQEYLQNDQASQAVKIMRDYWAIDPDQVEVHQILAVAYEKGGDLHQAIPEYARVIDEHLAMGDLAQAQPLYEKIKALNVEHRDVKRLRLTFEGRTIEPPPSSILVEPTHAQAPEEIFPEPVESKEAAFDEAALKNLFTETEVYIKYGLISKAVEQLEQVLEKNPDHVQAHLRLKEIYQVEGLKSQAVEECLKLAAIYKKLGDTEAYDKAIKEVRVLAPDLATQLESDHQEAEAEVPSAEAPAEASEAEDIEARMAEADLCYQRGLMAEAKKLYELILTLKPDHAGALAKLEDLVSADVQGKEVDYETHSPAPSRKDQDKKKSRISYL